MPTIYRKQSLVGYGQNAPATLRADATGLTPALRNPTVEAFRAQDKVAALSRRIVLSSGLRGDTAFRVPNTDPHVIAGAQTHPDNSTWYPIAHAMIEVTPGCFYRLTGACVPSGATQYQPNINDWDDGGRHGRLRLTCIWHDRDGATETTTHEVQLPGSTLLYGAEDTSAGGLWRTLRTFEIHLITPPFALTDIVELARFCRHVTCEMELEVQGSPRVVDLSVHEIPIATAVAIEESEQPW